jgi:SAM-dependent methyltransferase/tetratricopeptide (TPR) repeat protein
MEVTSLIVAGTPFSGAALLGHTLGAHAQAFFAGELWRQWDPAADPAARECRSCAGECATWNDPAVATAVADGPAAVSAALAATTGRRLVIEGPASASWLAARLAYGAACDEDTRVVVCVCDPLLYVRKRAGVTEEYARRRVAEWRDQQNALVSAALASGRPLLVVRYEDLVDRPAATLARVCAFAGLASEPTLADWWEAPSHALGAKSEAWGVAEPPLKKRAAAVPADPRQRRVETLSAQDRDPGGSLGPEIARAVIAEMRPTGLYETFGYAPLLPPYRAPRDEAEREKTAAWVREDLRITREAVVAGRAEEAIATLKLLVDHFGPAFDELGLEWNYANLAGVLVDLLNHQQRGAEALPYARALAEHAPENLEALRLLAVAGRSAGDLPATLAAYDRLVRSSAGADGTSESLSHDITELLVTVSPTEPALPAFLGTLAAHAELATTVDATLAARLQGGDRAEGVYAALDAVRAARGLPFCPHSPPEYLERRRSLLPSIWLGRFDSHAAWRARSPEADALIAVADTIDDSLMRSRHPHAVKAWCAVCSSPQMMNVNWTYGEVTGTGSFNPAWTETFICPSCGFNSRMRALYALLIEELQVPPTARIYLAEQVTHGYRIYQSRFPNLVGSEYLGATLAPGQECTRDKVRVRHEDHTNLSFATGSLDCVITQDVFEHIPDFRKALRESRRVLRPGGIMAFSIPFFSWQPETVTCARVLPDGTLEHVLPPEYHGNPLGNGSLCFHHLGWDILDELRQAGFAEAAAHLYWGPWQGHGGLPLFVFSARA